MNNVLHKLGCAALALALLPATTAPMPAQAQSFAELREVLQIATDPGETEAALAALTELAKSGHPSAQAELGRIWHQGIGVAPDPAQAVRFWQMAADQGHTGARYQLACALQQGAGIAADPVAALRLLRIGVEEGHVPSIANLARALETGTGTVPDQAEAVRLYERAAAEGQAFARFRLALALAAGAGVEADRARAVRLLEDLSDEGYAAATFALADVLMAERPSAGDRDRALALWRSDAEAGNDRALARLARHFPNDYVRLVQAALLERGAYRGRVHGRLTKRTILAIADVCRRGVIGDICRHGPMRSDAARALGQLLFPRSG
jgi:TPR repeat protein